MSEEGEMYLGPYYVCFVDGKQVKHKLVPYNTADEAMKEAKRLKEVNGMPTFIEGAGLPAHESKSFTSGWKVDWDMTGKLERYQKSKK